jgi:hypothetical protein
LCGLPRGLSNCHVHVNWNRLINTIVLITHLASCYAISVSDMRQARQPLPMTLEAHLIKSHPRTALHCCVDCSCKRSRHITFCLAKTLENHVHPTVHYLPHRGDDGMWMRQRPQWLTMTKSGSRFVAEGGSGGSHDAPASQQQMGSLREAQMQQQEQQEHICPSCKMHVGPACPQSLVTPHLARDAGRGANEMAWSADGLEGAVVATKLPVSLCSLGYTARLRCYCQGIASFDRPNMAASP